MSTALPNSPRAVEPTDIVLRRVPADWVVLDQGPPRPSGQAFNDDADGEPMSGYIDGLVAELGLERGDVLIDHAGFYLVGVGVDDLTKEAQVVEHDPIEPPVHPCDPAHAKVTGPKGSTGRRRRMARAAKWVEGQCPAGADAELPARR